MSLERYNYLRGKFGTGGGNAQEMQRKCAGNAQEMHRKLQKGL